MNELPTTARLSQRHLLNGSAELKYGRSPISFPEVNSAKSARKVANILTSLVSLNILGDDSAVSNQAMIHDFTGLTFVDTDLGQLTPSRFIHARTIVVDTKGGYVGGNGDQLKTARLNVPHDGTIPFITSGPCLFSAEATIGITASGKKHRLTDPYGFEAISVDEPIDQIIIDERLQPYEAEAILRLTQSIASIHNGEATVGLDLPRVAYKLYLLEYYLKGVITRESYQGWLQAIDARTEKIAALISRRLPDSMNVQIIEPLAPINDLIHQFADGYSLDGNEMQTLQSALCNSDELWGNVLLASPAQRFIDLGYLGYPMTHLVAARSAGPDSTLIVIESPEETKIMDGTFQALKAGCLRQPHAPIVGLYPHPDIIITNPESSVNERNFLYHYSGPMKPVMREIIKSSRKVQ